MMSIMRVLEPRRFFPEEIILRDLDEVEEMLFILKGDVTNRKTTNQNMSNIVHDRLHHS